ncbi:acyl-CoA oxidase [Karstenula rhodostoma CBS 690.94]|uniref:Acyl-coenzyme A oxidase n=1 Tax=Karstenula rhodostoma CBS 690.94 TaxID=1392251 RepID=A0A9P4U915_9PLEO|nr:acyl-CoA oxidase [Karstenula rhodostoma CBS 690.94]
MSVGLSPCRQRQLHEQHSPQPKVPPNPASHMCGVTAWTVTYPSTSCLSRDGFLGRRERVLKVLRKEKLFNKDKQLNLSRPERYHLGLARAKAIQRLVRPFHLHMTMFVTTIREQGSSAQNKFWMPRILEYDIIGCYAQSELGHGSNVKGLETEARWDPVAQEFELHSPYLTASKWWNGGMGRTATHTVPWYSTTDPDDPTRPHTASEYVPYGPQTFVVQIRHGESHQPLQGIAVGDIGPKYGYASMDNGYMLFDHVRVPKSVMLLRLTFVRGQIITHARLVLARAFQDRDGVAPTRSRPRHEVQVLDSPTVQIRILPLLAATFALRYTGEYMYNLYHESRRTIENGDFGPLAALHSASSGLKSLCTTIAADGIETCRRAMGGHGFGGGSGLVGLNPDYLSKPTVEGGNWMITQQVAAYLIKKMTQCVRHALQDLTEELFKGYIRDRARHTPASFLPADGSIDDDALVQIFQWRAAALSFAAYQARVEEKKPWTSLMIQLHNLSHAYSYHILVSTFHAALSSSSVASFSSPAPSSASSFLLTSAVSASDLHVLDARVLEMMTELRPHAVKLVDAWAVPDWVLDSALGRYDGKVYEDLFERAHRKNTLNMTTFNVDWRGEEVVLGSGDRGKQLLAKL